MVLAGAESRRGRLVVLGVGWRVGVWPVSLGWARVPLGGVLLGGGWAGVPVSGRVQCPEACEGVGQVGGPGPPGGDLQDPLSGVADVAGGGGQEPEP